MNDTNIITETEPVITAGEMLRNARTTGRRKRELSTVAKQLCIREEFLQALEDCNYSFIPELVYVLGFARNYAIELGLDPDVVVEKIKNEMGVVPDGVLAAPGEIIPDSQQKKFSFKETWNKIVGVVKNAFKYVAKHWLWFAISFGVIVIAVVLMLVFANSGENTETQTVETEVTEEVLTEPKYSVPVRERFGTENREKATIVLQAIEDSYVAVEDSRGKVVFGRSLVVGDVYYVPSGKHKAKFGNAGGIDVWVNNQLAPKVGKSHTAKSGIVLSEDSLMKAK